MKFNLKLHPGSEHLYKIDHFSGNLVPDGVQSVALALDSVWLMTDILISQKGVS